MCPITAPRAAFASIGSAPTAGSSCARRKAGGSSAERCGRSTARSPRGSCSPARSNPIERRPEQRKRAEMAQWNKYENTAARRHGRTGRDVRPKSLTLDIHAHVAIPQAAALAKPYLDMSTIPLAHFASAESKALGHKQEEDIRSRITGHDERLKELDA